MSILDNIDEFMNGEKTGEEINVHYRGYNLTKLNGAWFFDMEPDENWKNIEPMFEKIDFWLYDRGDQTTQEEWELARKRVYWQINNPIEYTSKQRVYVERLITAINEKYSNSINIKIRFKDRQERQTYINEIISIYNDIFKEDNLFPLDDDALLMLGSDRSFSTFFDPLWKGRYSYTNHQETSRVQFTPKQKIFVNKMHELIDYHKDSITAKEIRENRQLTLWLDKTYEFNGIKDRQDYINALIVLRDYCVSPEGADLINLVDNSENIKFEINTDGNGSKAGRDHLEMMAVLHNEREPEPW